jgi:hypothetical protein
MTDIDARLSEVAGLLNANLRAVAAAGETFSAITDALAGGSITAAALAALDGARTALDAQAARLASVPPLVGLTAAEVRVIRHRERQRVEEEALRHDGRPCLRAAGPPPQEPAWRPTPGPRRPAR